MRAARAAVVLLASLVAAPAARAGLIAVDDEVLVSPDAAAVQRHPAVAAGEEYGRNFVVVWEQETPGFEGIHLFSVATDGTEDSTPNSFTTGQLDGPGIAHNQAPDIAAIAGGEDAEFVVVWRSDPMNGDRPVITALLLGEHGDAAGNEFVVNTPRDVDGEYYLGEPRVTGADDGTFVVVWASGAHIDGDYGPRADVFARTFTSAGVPVTADAALSQANASEGETAFQPDVAATSDGGFVVVWAQGRNGLLGSQFETRALRLDSLGGAAGSEVDVGAGGLRGPRVGAAPEGGFDVAWPTFERTDVVPRAGSEVLARAFDSAGTPIGAAFAASSPATGTNDQGDPRVAFAGVNGVSTGTGGAGEFVVAWTSDTLSYGGNYGGSSDGDRSGIFTRVFTPTGDPFGAEFQVNQTTAGDQIAPELVVAHGKTVMIVWQGDHIYGRRYDLAVPRCADPMEDGTVAASDALFILQAAVGVRACDACLCDADGSDAVTAADALLVLRISIGSDAPAACPDCDDPFAVTFALETNAPCYGAQVVIASQGSVCAPSTALAGCQVKTRSYSDLEYEIRGCFLNAGPLFSCHVVQSTAETMARSADVACGCGCADTCPDTPVVCAQLEGGNVCAPGATRAAAPATVFATHTAEQSVTASTSTCATCCDTVAQADVSVDEWSLPISEVVIRFEASASADCPGSEASCEGPAATAGPGYTRTDGNQVELCLAAAESIFAPVLATCSIVGGEFGSGPVEVVRALDYYFRPIDPAPVVILNDQRR